MPNRTTRSLLAAAVLLGGASVTAQVPRPAPARPQQHPPAVATAGQAQLTDDARQALARIHWWNAFEVEAGTLAQQRGQSQPVKDLGRKLEQDARRVDGELTQLVSERGLDIATLPLADDARASQEQRMAKLRELQGEQFDRAFVHDTLEVQQRYEQELKAIRDRTPGADARLKKWLDDTENVAEGQVASARVVKRLVDDQRAARRAPAR